MGAVTLDYNEIWYGMSTIKCIGWTSFWITAFCCN